MSDSIIIGSYIDDFNKSPLLRHLVEEGSQWSTPGINVLRGKVNKKKTKVAELFRDLGGYGPLLDLIIRSTIPEMLVMQFSSTPSKVTEVINGPLYLSLLKKIKSKPGEEANLFTNLIDLWFKTKSNIRDYNTAYREKRAEIINSQVSNLLYCPYFIVCRQ